MKSQKLWAIFLLCTLFCMPLQAEENLVLPDWLLQIQQHKYKKPEAMLQLALQHEAESGSWPESQQAAWLNDCR